MNTQQWEITKKAMENPANVERTRNRKVFIPRTDIYETRDSIVLTADMPGVDEKSVDIILEKNILTITGKVEPQAILGYSLLYTEYESGDYERAFTISDEVDREGIDARVKNGILRITLPKKQEVLAGGKKISITKE
jgi:HSP20 family molecular chaperone IbpA